MSKKDEAPTAAELEAQVQAQREQLADMVDELATQLDPRQNIEDIKAQLSETAANANEHAQNFISRLSRGESKAVQIVGFAAVSILAVAGIALIRRNR